jgi:uncharacterized protein (TIGR03067 family)
VHILFAIVLLAQTAGAFELHVESSPKAPNAKAWTMRGSGGKPETVYLDSEVLMDARSIASAEVVQSPVGTPMIRVGLTPAGTSRIAEITQRYVGKKLGVVADGKLWSMPYLAAPVTGNVLMIAGNMTQAEAAAIAPKLGPPPTPSPGKGAVPPPAAAAPPRTPGPGVPELQGRWRVVDATVGDKPLVDPKITASSWQFRGDELILTNGEGQTARFVVRPDGAGAIHLETGKKEKGGWILWKRDKGDLILAFNDNLEGRPEGFAPAAKKIIARLRPPPPPGPK